MKHIGEQNFVYSNYILMSDSDVCFEADLKNDHFFIFSSRFLPIGHLVFCDFDEIEH